VSGIGQQGDRVGDETEAGLDDHETEIERDPDCEGALEARSGGGMGVAMAVAMPMALMAVIRRVIVRIMCVWAVMMAVSGHAIPPFGATAYHWFRRRC
jgi:hypothetical protein